MIFFICQCIDDILAWFHLILCYVIYTYFTRGLYWLVYECIFGRRRTSLSVGNIRKNAWWHFTCQNMCLVLSLDQCRQCGRKSYTKWGRSSRRSKTSIFYFIISKIKQTQIIRSTRQSNGISLETLCIFLLICISFDFIFLRNKEEKNLKLNFLFVLLLLKQIIKCEEWINFWYYSIHFRLLSFLIWRVFRHWHIL